MKCIDPNIGNLISLYEFNQLSDEERRKFETHLLECDYCFQNLYSLSPVIEKIKEDPEPFLAVLQKKESVWVRLKNEIVEFGESFENIWGQIPLVWQYTIPAVAAVSVLFFVFFQSESELSNIAHIEPLPYRSLKVKGSSLKNKANQLFEKGMEAYTRKNYSTAVEILELALQKDSTNEKFPFYIGISYLLLDDADPAIIYLKKTIDLADNLYREKAYWYLGNAWLVKGKRQYALDSFNKVIEFEGDYEWEAREMIKKIQNFKKENN